MHSGSVLVAQFVTGLTAINSVGVAILSVVRPVFTTVNHVVKSSIAIIASDLPFPAATSTGESDFHGRGLGQGNREISGGSKQRHPSPHTEAGSR